MPRRRLHGVTQKRRQKAKSAALKRSRSPVRSSVTDAPAPFERSGDLRRQDVEFLEAMRELQVSPNRRRPISPERLQSVERVQFLADTEGKADFLKAMERMGVRPLGSNAPRFPARRGPAVQGLPESVPQSPASPPPGLRPLPPGSILVRAADLVLEQAAKPARTAEIASNGQFSHPRRGSTTFADDPVDMEALLAGHVDPARKYEGAPAVKPLKADSRASETNPDEELDLHGKTVEEAIRMVQNFLRSAYRRRYRSVVIVTGRGLNSGQNGPVLRGAVLAWLERNGTPYCREFGLAPGRHGGDGAILIRLR